MAALRYRPPVFDGSRSRQARGVQRTLLRILMIRTLSIPQVLAISPFARVDNRVCDCLLPVSRRSRLCLFSRETMQAKRPQGVR
jgi:hypothetical protein